MSKESSIKVFAENFSGSDNHALTIDGGQELKPYVVSGCPDWNKLMELYNVVSTNSANW